MATGNRRARFRRWLHVHSTSVVLVLVTLVAVAAIGGVWNVVQELHRHEQTQLAEHEAEQAAVNQAVAASEYANCVIRAKARDALRAFIREAIVTVWAESGQFTQQEINNRVAFYLDGLNPAIPVIMCVPGATSSG